MHTVKVKALKNGEVVESQLYSRLYHVYKDVTHACVWDTAIGEVLVCERDLEPHITSRIVTL